MTDLLKQHAGFFRRSAALVYDALVLFAVYFLVTAIAIALNEGENVSSAWLRLFFLVTTYLFFSWFWLHGGQTLGMRAWRLRLVDKNGRPPTLKAVTVRFIAAIVSWTACGLGHIWMLIDTRKLAWHDRLSQTFVVLDNAHDPATVLSDDTPQ
ncbi:MAG: RDD family protein [Gammaproteobacteria bacterium]|nr:RDD family protein [Gammaproteobacteria bacterium]